MSNKQDETPLAGLSRERLVEWLQAELRPYLDEDGVLELDYWAFADAIADLAAQGQPEAEVTVAEIAVFIAQELRVLNSSNHPFHQRGEIVARNLATWARVTRRAGA